MTKYWRIISNTEWWRFCLTWLSGYFNLHRKKLASFLRWRQVVKGLFDKRGDELNILVTGSARLDHYRRGGDALQGRYPFYRLFPLTCSELGPPTPSTVKDLLTYGGFPESYLLHSQKKTRRWSREYRSRVIQEDLASLENVIDLGIIENLVLRLPDLVSVHRFQSMP